jgi:hypothetical protein
MQFVFFFYNRANRPNSSSSTVFTTYSSTDTQPFWLIPFVTGVLLLQEDLLLQAADELAKRQKRYHSSKLLVQNPCRAYTGDIIQSLLLRKHLATMTTPAGNFQQFPTPVNPSLAKPPDEADDATVQSGKTTSRPTTGDTWHITARRVDFRTEESTDRRSLTPRRSLLSQNRNSFIVDPPFALSFPFFFLVTISYLCLEGQKFA